MREILIDTPDPNAEFIWKNVHFTGKTTLVNRRGREYKRFTYTRDIHRPLYRVINFIKAFTITLFTAFFALISSNVRAQLVESISGKESLILFTSIDPKLSSINPEVGDYVRFTINEDILLRRRVIKLIKAFAITLFTAFFGLISSNVRTLWSESISGKAPCSILIPKSNFEKNNPDSLGLET
jgi:flagellar biosynthesis protein FlhB